MAINWSKVRVWQVKFEVHQPLKSLPLPDLVVEEVQESPEYRVDGALRKTGGSQLQVTIGGRGMVRVNGKDHELLPGRGFLHNHMDPGVCYYYPPDGVEVWNFLWIAFDNAEKMVREINQRYGYVYHLPLERGVVKKLGAYRNFRGAIQVLSPLAGAGFVMDILAELADTHERKLIESPRSVLVSKAQRHIMERMGTELGIAELAEALQVSREHLSRVFLEQTGMSPSEYLCKSRMRLACDLLLQSGLSCKEIAARVGFNDHSSFSRAFRQVVGMSPRALRENGYRPEL